MNYRTLHSIFLFICLFLICVDVGAAEPAWGPKYIKLSDVTISCDAYEKYYKDIVENAAKNNSSDWNSYSFKKLDEAFGTYKTGWIKSNTWIMGEHGQKLPTHKSVANIKCKTVTKKVKVYDTTYNYVTWDWVKKTYVEQYKTYEEIRNGYIDDCKIKVYQDIWPDLGKCGTGTIVRRFKIGLWCGNREYKLELKQNIHVVPGCKLSKGMIDVPDVYTVCQSVGYTGARKVDLPDHVPTAKLRYPIETCSKISKGYSDKIYKLIQEDNTWVVIRTWTFSDWCSGTSISADQKIMIIDTCGVKEDPKEDPKEPDPDDSLDFRELSPLNDLQISYSAYADKYKDIVELALEKYQGGDVELSENLLNSIFGSYSVKNESSDVDSTEIFSENCTNNTPTDTSYFIRDGIIQSDCPDSLDIRQELVSEYTNCGITGLRRDFIIESKCRDSLIIDTLSQHIFFISSCPLSSASFLVPADTVICGVLQKDSLERIILPVNDQPTYVGSEPRSFDSDYKFTVSYSSDEPYKTNVKRIWTFIDTCRGEETMFSQELILVDTCSVELRKEERKVSKSMNPGYAHLSGVVDNNTIHNTTGLDSRDDYEGGFNRENRSKVYPNPFKGNLNVNINSEGTGKADIRIFDIAGKAIYQSEIQTSAGSNLIDISGGEIFKNPGMYFVRVSSKDFTENFKVIYQP
ncbi:T9SS type A sorting domain-containing protein [Membranihabitans maritimus]|uniref:T9SS type A sorting domain-containing protein n=1 Tax=Membranihabitans maritimus TaxID=2904244 RepID=UPI001F28B15F|nr:T9SS type A sorting domain-containing protein [Membranihabitans maritimus]